MAIAHVVFKSSSTAPPAALHAEYILRDGQYARRGEARLTESGNMPEFAQADPRAFWVAADTHERVNGRAYTEIQLALPRELDEARGLELAREAAREFMGDRFAYTLAVHVPVARDKVEQPHLHLMFSERAVDETTRTLPRERFFRRNGAKKDPAWNARTKPEEVRQRWCEMMNRAMQEAGIEERVDPRSYKDRGRGDLAELREPKLLAGSEEDARQLRAHVDDLREQRAELPPAHLDREEAAAWIDRETEAQIAEVERSWSEKIRQVEEKIAAFVKETAEKAVRAFTDKANAVARMFSGADLFATNTNAKLDRQKESEAKAEQEARARLLERTQRAQVPEDLDMQLRQIARSKARNPERRIDALEDIPGIDFTGKVLGYTSGGEEALVESRSGNLLRLRTQGKRSVRIGEEIEIDRRTGQISREGHSL